MSASAITANANANIQNICIYSVRIGQNRCQMTQKHTFFEKRVEKFWKFRNSYYFCAPKQTGCSSARLEYTSGGRGVASSNLVTPTKQSKSLQSKDWRLLCYKVRSCLHVCGLCCTKVLALQGKAFALFSGHPTSYDHRAESHLVWVVAR